MIARLIGKGRAATDVLRAAVAVSRARRSVAHSPLGSLVQTGAVSPASSGLAALAPHQQQIVRRWAAAVDRALRWVPGDESGCLVRARALRDLLADAGMSQAEVRIGVRRGAAGFEAHAWVEFDGIPIAEPDALRGAFVSLDGVTMR